MATNTMVKKEQSAPYAVMATSFIKPAGVKVLTTDNTIESYPACRMWELHKLANMFDWIIMPLSLCDFRLIVKAYSRENVYYAWQLFHAFNRFKAIASSEGMSCYIIAPLEFMDTYQLMTNYSGVREITEESYFPDSLKKLKEAFEWLRPTLEDISTLVKGLTARTNFNPNIIVKEIKKKDPCILCVRYDEDINNPNTIARIGLCWGEELTEYVVDDLSNNEGSFSRVTFPWSKNMIRKVTVDELDQNHKIRDKYFNVEKAYFEFSAQFLGIIGVADETITRNALKTLKKTFLNEYDELEEIQTHLETYFKINGHASCVARHEELYGCSACTRHEKFEKYENGCNLFIRLTLCETKQNCGKRIRELCDKFFKEFLKDYYVNKLQGLLKEQKYTEMLDFIPFIKTMEENVFSQNRVEGIKEAFPEFWTFYEMVTRWA